ncbi:MAG: hypothetical protein J6V88_02480 [Kiritimatiellae bacterium]|nr:hypothetical protein [Kiritimatiellia bacterium]
MRGFRALAHASTMEALSGPLSSVLFLVGVLSVHLSSVFHYHQFGNPLRLPHECGLSALFVFGLLFATSAVFRTVEGELSSGTASVALVRPLSRSLFFCSKVFGVFVALGVFLVGVFSASLLSSITAGIGQVMSMKDGTTRLWPMGVQLGVVSPILSFFLAAACNRFFQMRFCFTSCLMVALSQPVALLIALSCMDMPFASTGIDLLSVVLDFSCVTAAGFVFVAIAGALSVRLKPSYAAGLLVVMTVFSFLINLFETKAPLLAHFFRTFLPDLGKVWMPQDFMTAIFVVGACFCVTVIWLIIGSILIRGKEIL